jgi:hypothetical protein
MKHNLSKFNQAVKYYETKLKKHSKKTLFCVFDSANEKAFFSIAPFSRAAHNLGMDLSVGMSNKRSETLPALMRVWDAFKDLESGVNNEVTQTLGTFIKIVDEKAKGDFRKIFRAPDVLMDASPKGFVLSTGEELEFKADWIKKYRWNELLKTTAIIWKQVFNIKKNERVGMGFDLIMKANEMKDPLEDYMDSYLIARAMYLTCPAGKKSMKATTNKTSMMQLGERTSELSATLLGCELEKDIDESVFQVYKKLSELLELKHFVANDATFFIAGEGYGGRHIFGEVIGYPTPNKKSKWSTPSGIIYQFPWQPQTKIDERAPLCRVGFTDTLPIDIFITACNLDWMAVKRKNDKLIDLVNKSEKIIVDSDKTKLEIGLIKPNGERRTPMNSDVDARDKLDEPALKKGILAGNMVNVPGGEIFVTPQYVKGTFYGDVVINIDKSIVLNSKKPFVVQCNGNEYKVLSGPKDVIKTFNAKRKEAMKMLLRQEKNKSLPAEIIKMKKDNFNNIGEFAINTNPKAQLCNYLIVNEKIAGMIHLALGSGYEDDRSSVYHYDCVINAKEQKLDICGIGKNGEKYWMMKQGKLCVK